MKLRNKKTQEIRSIEEIIRDAFLSNELDLLKNIDANWEEIEPKEPLIKDEKIRKAVRAWAEAYDIENVFVSYLRDDSDFVKLSSTDNTDIQITICLDVEEVTLSIAELCGEEEECES